MKFNLFNCKAFRKKKHVVQGGAILDEVISQSCSPTNKILLYKLANYKLGKLCNILCSKNLMSSNNNKMDKFKLMAFLNVHFVNKIFNHLTNL